MEILEHFDWPKEKTDALREAAFEYQKLMKLKEEVSSFVDNPKLTCEVALNKMNSLLDKYVMFLYYSLSIMQYTRAKYLNK